MTTTDEEPRRLGFTFPEPEPEPNAAPIEIEGGVALNTRVSLWKTRWPAIALQECIDKVEAAPVEKRVQVKLDLPCATCDEASRCLNAKRKELGPLLYDREINTQPRSSESTLFPRTSWMPMLMRDETLVPYWHKPFSLEHEYTIVQAWDLAWSEKIGGDWLVCITAYVHLPTGTRQILNIERWQQIAFDEQVKLIERKWRQYQADMVVIEGDAAQAIWKQHVGRNTAVPVVEHTASEKTDFAVGVPGLLITMQNRKWRIPHQRHSMNYTEVENMLDEFEAFGWVDGKLEGVGEHDDTVMCFWHLAWGLERALLWGGTGDEAHRGNVPGARR